MPGTRSIQKPYMPVRRAGDPLWNGCIWAVLAGANRGHRNTSKFVEQDDVRKVRGVIDGSAPGTHAINNQGNVLYSGSSVDKSQWDDPSTYYDIQNSQFSCAVWYRFVATPNNGQRFFGKRANGGGTSAGWEILYNNAIFAEWSDGVGDQSLSSGVAGNTTDDFLIVLTHDGTTVRFYINGVFKASVASTRDIANNSEPIELFGVGSSSKNDGEAGMAAVWNRPLNGIEIARLYSDPYRMWRPPASMQAPLGSVLANPQSFFMSF